jgi:hypothetical protein
MEPERVVAIGNCFDPKFAFERSIGTKGREKRPGPVQKYSKRVLYPAELRRKAKSTSY